MQVHEVQYLLQHLVDSLLALASVHRCFLYILLAILVHAKACGPDYERHGDKLSRDLQSVGIAFDEL